MEVEWCRQMIEGAILLYGKPKFLNSDQGGQYTSGEFSHFVLSQGNLETL